MEVPLRRNRIIILLVVGTFIILLAVAIAYGVQVWIRKVNPLMDVPRAEFDKTVNVTRVRIGDVIKVEVFIGWHGHVLPEFRRDVKIVDPFPEDYFILVDESNICEYRGRGPGPGFSYSLKVVGGLAESVMLPKPIFYLDEVEIPLSGTSPIVQIIQTTS